MDTCGELCSGVQIEDYERSAEEDEHFGIDHLKAEQQAEPKAPLEQEAEQAAVAGAGI